MPSKNSARKDQKRPELNRLSSYCPEPGEAFIFLVLENYYSHWVSCNKGNEEIQNTLWTSKASNKANGKRYSGWSDDGVVRFNTLCENICNARSVDMNTNERIERALIDVFYNQIANKSSHKKRKIAAVTISTYYALPGNVAAEV